MKKWLTIAVLAVILIWWLAAAPRADIAIAASVRLDPATAAAIKAVDHSADFAAHAWVKPPFMRIPPKLLLREPRRTGVLVLSPDGRRPLYAAMYQGPLLPSIPSAVATPAGVYLANLALGDRDRQQTGIVRLDWPSSLRSPER